MTDWTKARELCERATGPRWVVGPYYNSEGHGIGPIVHDVGHADSDAIVCERATKSDAEFIAAARTLLPEAIERIARLEAIAREAIATGIRLAGLECSSADEDRLAALLEEVDRG